MVEKVIIEKKSLKELIRRYDIYRKAGFIRKARPLADKIIRKKYLVISNLDFNCQGQARRTMKNNSMIYAVSLRDYRSDVPEAVLQRVIEAKEMELFIDYKIWAYLSYEEAKYLKVVSDPLMIGYWKNYEAIKRGKLKRDSWIWEPALQIDSVCAVIGRWGNDFTEMDEAIARDRGDQS